METTNDLLVKPIKSCSLGSADGIRAIKAIFWDGTSVVLTRQEIDQLIPKKNVSDENLASLQRALEFCS